MITPDIAAVAAGMLTVSVLVGLLASSWGRVGILYFVASLALSPIIAGIILMIRGRKAAAANVYVQPMRQPMAATGQSASVKHLPSALLADAWPPQKKPSRIGAWAAAGIAAIGAAVGFGATLPWWQMAGGPATWVLPREVQARQLVQAALMVERELADPAQQAVVDCLAGRPVLHDPPPKRQMQRDDCRRLFAKHGLPPSAIGRGIK